MTEEILLTFTDYGFMFLVAIALPVWSYFDHKRDQRRQKEGRGETLTATYIKTYIALWVPTIALLAFWISSGRGMEGLGLTLSLSSAGAIAFAVVLILTALLTVQVFQAKNNRETAEKFMEQLEAAPAVNDILPTTDSEYRLFKGLSVTAGITEEILDRKSVV